MDMVRHCANLTRRPVDFLLVKIPPQSASEEQRHLVSVPSLAELNVHDIHPNRISNDFTVMDMEELIHSVREIGVLQRLLCVLSRKRRTKTHKDIDNFLCH